ncbi:uncharacterized protein DFL_000390 [Arthrobotrys flagrans]|uniref:BTB domain-containing protein n=1 Tax=Arthrobotrys flagrans TaxID=97331 RepID=A0A437ADL4_ARTFL|nr:hypothetical protein DFL_000390 [Arthrobotrys flagrans]
MENYWEDLVEEYSKNNTPPEVSLVWDKNRNVRIEVHKAVVTQYSTFISGLLSTAATTRRTNAPPEVLVPCDSKTTLHRVIGWMYYKEFRTTFLSP